MEPSSEPILLANLGELPPFAEGVFTAFAMVRQMRRGETRAGKPYFDLKLADRHGTVTAKVWSDAGRAMQAVEALSVGAHIKLLFEVERYRGTPQLNVRRLRLASEGEPGYIPDQLREDGLELIEGLSLKTLVFDIETVPATDLRKAPPTIAQAVAKQVERNEWDQSKVMSLSPWFGQVVSLAVGDGEEDPRTQEVTVFVVPPPGTPDAALRHSGWIRSVTEPQLLRAFWALAAQADVVVSYNGRGFDVPFLVGRSLIHGIPARVDLLSNRYSIRPHLDLWAVLGSGRGPSSLDVVCWALGLTSPKEEMDGSMVATAYAKGDVASIALYNAGDVRATSGVYQRVRDGVLRYRDDW